MRVARQRDLQKKKLKRNININNIYYGKELAVK